MDMCAMLAHKFNESTYTFIGRSNRTDACAYIVRTTNIKSEDETLNSHFILLNGYVRTGKKDFYPHPWQKNRLKITHLADITVRLHLDHKAQAPAICEIIIMCMNAREWAKQSSYGTY